MYKTDQRSGKTVRTIDTCSMVRRWGARDFSSLWFAEIIAP